MSRQVGNRYEDDARRYLETLGFSFIAANIYLEGGEIDLVVQATLSIQGCVDIGEVCIVEVKGRRRMSEWNTDLISSHKRKRWGTAALALVCEFDDGRRLAPLNISGFQTVLVQIENAVIDVQWNAFDLDLG